MNEYFQPNIRKINLPKDIQLKYVKKKFENWTYIKNPCNELQMKLVSDNFTRITSISNPDPNVIECAILQCPIMLRHFNENTITKLLEIKIVKKLYKDNIFINIKYLSYENSKIYIIKKDNSSFLTANNHTYNMCKTFIYNCYDQQILQTGNHIANFKKYPDLYQLYQIKII